MSVDSCAIKDNSAISDNEIIDSTSPESLNSGKLVRHVPDPDFTGQESCLTTSFSTLSGDNNLLPTILMDLKVNGITKTVRVMLDCAATNTFVSSALVQQIGIKYEDVHRLQVETIHGRSNTITFNEVEFPLFSKVAKNVHNCLKVKALVAGFSIRVPEFNPPKTRKWKEYTFTERFPRTHESPIDVILGGQLFHAIFQGFKYDSKHLDFLPFQSAFGDGIVFVKDSIDTLRSCFSTIVSTPEENWEDLVRKFFTMTSNDIDMAEKESSSSVEVQETNSHFRETIRYDVKSSRYVTKVAFRDNIRQLEPNFKRAYARLVRTEQTLDEYTKETGIDHARLYADAMKELIGDIIELDDDQSTTDGCFLAHRAVFKLDKANAMKTRIVFDASMKGKNKLSLNDCIKTYENIIPNLREILLHQRFSKYLLLTDIKKFFLSVLCDESQRKFYRLIWREKASDPPKIYKFKTHIFGDVSAPARSVKALLFHLEKFRASYPVVVEQLEKSLYMDDAHLHCNDDKELLARYLTAKYILKLGGFKLGKTVTNSKFVNDAMDPGEKAEMKNFYDEESYSGVTTLGLGFVTGLDSYMITNGKEIYEMSKDLPCTRRNIMKICGKLFDSCGFIEPFRVLAKFLLQRSWIQKSNWDEVLDQATQAKWKKWVDSLPLLQDFLIPRYIPVEEGSKLSIEAFSDASKDAAACAIYLRVSDSQKAKSYLLYSASSVKTCDESIPRKEINGALMGAQRCMEYAQFLRIPKEDCHLFTDSFVVLCWLRRAHKETPAVFRTYVANRIEKILNLLHVSNIHYVNTQANPSDFPSRGMGMQDLLDTKIKSMWLNGPQFLESQTDNFRFIPESKMGKVETDMDAVYEKEVKNPNTVAVCAVTLCLSEFNLTLMTLPVPVERFSDYRKLISVSYYVFKFIAKLLGHLRKNEKRREYKVCNLLLAVAIEGHNVRKMIHQLKKAKVTDSTFTGPDWDITLRRMIEFAYVQQDQISAYGEDFIRLRKGEELTKDSKLKKLTPFFDREYKVLRVQTRLAMASETNLDDGNEFYTCPVLMPKTGKFTKIYCMNMHSNNFHYGHNYIFHKIRETYFIPAGKFLLRNLISNCGLCNRYHAKRMKQRMADLPVERVSVPKLYDVCVIDHAGPFWFKDKLNSKETSKGYLMVITCAQTRLTYIALCEDFTAATFMMSLEEFFHKWRVPSVIFTDQHPSYKPVASCLELIFASWNEKDRHEMFERVQSRGVRWRFNVIHAPWRISVVERLNACLKKALYLSLGKARVTRRFFQHLVSRIEDAINRRPYMEVSADVNDAKVLCPKSFIFGDVPQPMPMQDFMLEYDKRTDVKDDLLEQFKDRNNAFKHFVQAWKFQYLDRLIGREKWVCQSKPAPVGSIVLVAKENVRSIFFPMATVLHHHPNPDDGLVREYTVRLSDGKVKRLPCTDLCRLEVDQDEIMAHQEHSSKKESCPSGNEEKKKHSHSLKKRSKKKDQDVALSSHKESSNLHSMETRSKRKALLANKETNMD